MIECENVVVIVKEFLVVFMIFDVECVVMYMYLEVKIIFIGGWVMVGVVDIVQFNGVCYKWVKKVLGEFDVVQYDDYVVIYFNGMLYGEWFDGCLFVDNCFIDCFEVCDGKIIWMDVWNDSVEWILVLEIFW